MVTHLALSNPASFSQPDEAPLLPLLLIGHGSRDPEGQTEFLKLAATYQAATPHRPIFPCFLELTDPSIADGIQRCLEAGYQEVIALPVLLFGARHNKYDVTLELDRWQQIYPQLKLHYGGPLGIRNDILDLLRQRLVHLQDQHPQIAAAETVLLFVGRGSSDPEANGEACKLARMVWEGSGYASVETCFIGITHPRLSVGFARALLLKPRRLIVIPYFLFTGVLLKKIEQDTQQQRQQHPEVEFYLLPEIGIHPTVLTGLWEREQEAIAGTTPMNCHLCKFRRAVATQTLASSGHLHHPTDPHDHDAHSHPHPHRHAHPHSHASVDVYEREADYHQKIWQVP
ncbi:MAG: sirohydrochlorin chelatase [Cyanobacteriota bacterium]|nr:sirohydrochlorin chelatase [Cyanobacteriota bacterium]